MQLQPGEAAKRIRALKENYQNKGPNVSTVLITEALEMAAQALEDLEAGLLIRLPYAPETVFHQDLKGEYDVTFTGRVAYEIVSGDETEYLDAEDLAEMVEECRKSLEEDTTPKAPRHCRICGCTDDHACPGGCWWVAKDLCSACVGKEEQQAVPIDTSSGAAAQPSPQGEGLWSEEKP